MTRGPSLKSQGCAVWADGEAEAPREDIKGTGGKVRLRRQVDARLKKFLEKWRSVSSFFLLWTCLNKILGWCVLILWKLQLRGFRVKTLANKMVSQGSCFYGNYVSMLHTYGVAQTVVLPWNYSKTSHPENVIALLFRLFWKMWLLRQTSRCLSEHGEYLISFFHYIVFENLFLINFLTDFSLQLLFRDYKKKKCN